MKNKNEKIGKTAILIGMTGTIGSTVYGLKEFKKHQTLENQINRTNISLKPYIAELKELHKKQVQQYKTQKFVAAGYSNTDTTGYFQNSKDILAAIEKIEQNKNYQLFTELKKEQEHKLQKDTSLTNSLSSAYLLAVSLYVIYKGVNKLFKK